MHCKKSVSRYRILTQKQKEHRSPKSLATKRNDALDPLSVYHTKTLLDFLMLLCYHYRNSRTEDFILNGRPKTLNANAHVSTYLEKEQLDIVVRFTKTHNIKRAELFRTLIQRLPTTLCMNCKTQYATTAHKVHNILLLTCQQCTPITQGFDKTKTQSIDS